MYIFWGIIKRGFPVSLSSVLKCSSNIQRSFCLLLMHCSFVLPATCLLLIRWCPLIDRELSCTCPVIMRSLCVLCAPYTNRESLEQQRDDFHHRITFCHNLSIRFYLCDVRLRYPASVTAALILTNLFGWDIKTWSLLIIGQCKFIHYQNFLKPCRCQADRSSTQYLDGNGQQYKWKKCFWSKIMFLTKKITKISGIF